MGGGGYYAITTVCQPGHWLNLAQPFDVFSVLGSNIIARKPYIKEIIDSDRIF